jgi:hypothetical protein
VLPIIGLLTTLLVAAPASEASVKAYVAAWRGELPEARAHAAAALAKDPGDGPALLVAACVEIEEGHFLAAGALAAKLAAIKPPPPEAEVIRLLAERRRSSPTERMEDSLASAWKAAGRPDLGKTGVMRLVAESAPQGMQAIPGIEPSELRRRSRSDAFLVGPMASPYKFPERETNVYEAYGKWRAVRKEEALVLARAPESNSLTLNTCLYPWLEKGQEARRRVATALERALPTNGYPILALTLDGSANEAPLTGPELDALEAAARLPEFGRSLHAVQIELVRALREVDRVHAELMVSELLASCPGPPLFELDLARRAKATQDPALGKRAAAITETVGRRLQEHGTMLDVMVGFVLRGIGAELRGVPARDADMEKAETWRMRIDAATAASGVLAWPLPTRWRQWDPEREVQFLSQLADSPMPP